ncbi:MAG: HEAT repeat domain-containing protein [Singulisphaera sp.]
MAKRRGTGLAIAGVLGGVAAVALTFGIIRHFRGTAAPRPEVIYDASTPPPILAVGLRHSDARALVALSQRVTPKPNTPAVPVSEAEAESLIEVLGGLRTGFLKFSGHARAGALVAACHILDRFAAKPAPSRWIEALPPVHDLLISGLADRDLDVRVTALVQVGRLWTWAPDPGRTMFGIEERSLAVWHARFLPAVVRRLADREPESRAAAVACLGRVPIDEAALPALAYLEDPASGEVRQQVLVSFAGRPALLSEDALLKRLYDPHPGVAEAAEIILKARGLSREQIGLGRLIFHPKPELRASVIPLIRKRTDIDPVIWLLQLSRDAEESVRAGALEAFAGRITPEVRARIAEMAASDRSPVVRQAAVKLISSQGDTTAALPPLPGSTSLNPKAN